MTRAHYVTDHKKRKALQNNLTQDAPYNVVENYHQRSRAPHPPNPRQLEKVRSHNGQDMSAEAAIEDEQCSKGSMDDKQKSRAWRHSQKHYTGNTADPEKLGFYPPLWHDVLGKAQKLWRHWMALECGFPKSNIEAHLDMAMQCVTDALSEHQKNGGRVENGSDCIVIFVFTLSNSFL
jgi:hypothetical protein